MTGKRFLVKYLEYEAYYVDTEKEYVDTDYYLEIDEYPTMSDEQVVECLNKFFEEKEQLKEQNKELKQNNDIKFWKLQLMEQWNNTELISHELYLAIENGYEISDEFKKHLDGLKKKHEEHMKKAERLGI